MCTVILQETFETYTMMVTIKKSKQSNAVLAVYFLLNKILSNTLLLQNRKL